MENQRFLNVIKLNLHKIQNLYEKYVPIFLNKNFYVVLIFTIYFFTLFTSLDFRPNMLSKTLLLGFCPFLILISNLIYPNLFDMSNISASPQSLLVLTLCPAFLILIEIINSTSHTDNKNNISENEELLIFVHDLKNLMLPALGYAEIHNLEKTKNKLFEICKKLNETSVLTNISTVNFLIENIITVKRPIMDCLKIDINYKVDKINKINMKDEDFCSLMGNIIDNAIEACNKISEINDRFINFEIYEYENSLNIIMENSTLPSQNTDLKTEKSNKLLHGYGIKSIEQIVKRYNGKVKFSSENNIFLTQVSIPIQ